MKKIYNRAANSKAASSKQESPTVLSDRVRIFWQSDLEEVEGCFLKGKRITDLPIRKPDRRAPSQGSVLLGRIRNIDHDVPMPNRWMARLLRFLHPSTN
jgi:hypothetical protein